MTAPTRDEIKAGYDAITRDGISARITEELALLALRDPLVSGTVKRILDGAFTLRLEDSLSPLALHGVVMGALIAGLHLGLYIGESRRP